LAAALRARGHAGVSNVLEAMEATCVPVKDTLHHPEDTCRQHEARGHAGVSNVLEAMEATCVPVKDTMHHPEDTCRQHDAVRPSSPDLLQNIFFVGPKRGSYLNPTPRTLNPTPWTF